MNAKCILYFYYILLYKKIMLVKKAAPFKLSAELAGSGLVPRGARRKAGLGPLGGHRRGRRWFCPGRRLLRDQRDRHELLLLLLLCRVPRLLLQLLALPWNLDHRSLRKFITAGQVTSSKSQNRRAPMRAPAKDQVTGTQTHPSDSRKL